MTGVIGWLHGPEFETIEGACPWVLRSPGSCGPRAASKPTRACAERTDYRWGADLR